MLTRKMSGVNYDCYWPIHLDSLLSPIYISIHIQSSFATIRWDSWQMVNQVKINRNHSNTSGISVNYQELLELICHSQSLNFVSPKIAARCHRLAPVQTQ